MADYSKRSLSDGARHNTSFSEGKKGGKKTGKPKLPTGQVRIIAGHWRGRKLPVIDSNGLRPTGDRVRETVFNWLQNQLPGSDCLDLYAGSGALGLEAASRGARRVSLVESSRPVAESLKATLVALQADDLVSLYGMSAEQFLTSHGEKYDLVFVDPPFSHNAHIDIVHRLVEAHLHHAALVYLELPTKESALLASLPASLQLFRERRFGDVTVFLLQYHES